MAPELFEIKDFLAQHPPFEFLPQKEVAHAASHIEIGQFRASETILTYGGPGTHLYIVRSGLVELFRCSGDLYNRIDSGSIFGWFGLLMNKKVRFTAVTIEDTLVYCLPEEIFNEFCETSEDFSDYVEVDILRKSIRNSPQKVAVLLKVRFLLETLHRVMPNSAVNISSGAHMSQRLAG